MNWQPIETAPKDRDVLLYVTETDEQFVAFWDQALDDDCKWVFASGGRTTFIVLGATHWTPLPEPPQ